MQTLATLVRLYLLIVVGVEQSENDNDAARRCGEEAGEFDCDCGFGLVGGERACNVGALQENLRLHTEGMRNL